LAALNKGLEPELVELYFKLHLLNELGHKPHLKTESAAKYYFSFSGGKVSSERTAESVAISQDEIKLWRLVEDYPLGQVAKVKGIGQAASHSLGMLNRFYDYLYDKRFKSAEI
jgi:hypothetical protein